jgi:drug/metabolite transporter (DMT)-like permease
VEDAVARDAGKVPTLVPLEVEVFHHHLGRSLASIVLLSLASAASYGLGAVLQHGAAAREPAELSMQAGLLVRLARRPRWLTGTLLDGLGYLFQFLALRRGSLSLVEPVLVLSLVFALPVAARLDHRPIRRAELIPAVVIVIGVGLFLGAARPGVGRPDTSATAWVVLSVVVAGLCGAMTLGTLRGSRRRTALLLAAASGTAFGYVAAVTERTGHLLNLGALHALFSFAPYVLVVAAVAALLLTQSSFHAGLLRLSLPTITIAQPLVAVAIGLGVFGERIDTGALALIGEIFGVVLATLGVFSLARTPSNADQGPEA